VVVAAGGARIVFAFEPLELDSAASADRDVLAATPTGVPAARETPSQDVGPPPAVPQGPWRTVGFSLGGVGLVAGLAGGIVATRAISKAGSTNDLSVYEDQRTPYNAGLVIAGLGGALLATGVALVITHPNAPAAARLQMTPTVGAGTGGLALTGGW
jgi:hypothetical protein